MASTVGSRCPMPLSSLTVSYMCHTYWSTYGNRDGSWASYLHIERGIGVKQRPQSSVNKPAKQHLVLGVVGLSCGSVCVSWGQARVGQGCLVLLKFEPRKQLGC
jgi:hypothetical protein